jgi:putative methanogenesis marker protein 6
MIGPIPPLYAGTVTKYVFIESYKTTPADIAARAYEVSGGVMIKETCFGLQITGKEEEVDRVISHVREVDPAHIYVKDRGFPPGDPRRCRANLGGARPGYFGHEFEMGFIRRISIGLEKIDSPAEIPAPESEQKDKEGLSVKRLMELIAQEA